MVVSSKWLTEWIVWILVHICFFVLLRREPANKWLVLDVSDVSHGIGCVGCIIRYWMFRMYHTVLDVSDVCKVVPRQAVVAQGVPGILRPRIFLTFRHYKCGRSSAKRTGHLYPRRNPWYSLSEAESTSGHMVLSGVPRKKSPVTPPGIDPGTVKLVAQCLNHYATPGSLTDV